MSAEEANFEEPIVRIRRRIEELSGFPEDREKAEEIEKLREKLDKVCRDIYGTLSPWQKTLVARHPLRPYTLDYVRALTSDWVEIHGDRGFGDDPAIVAGFGIFDAKPVRYERENP